MSEKEYEQPPSIAQLISINTKLGKNNRQLQARLTTVEKENAHIITDIKNQLSELQKDGITLETQNRIRDCVNSECGAPPDFIDGSGCESGDPVDLTLSEIMQGFNYYADTYLEPLEKKLSTATATVERLRELLGKAWNVVSDLDEQCASDVATACWPTKLGYSEKDVRRINKEIEAFMEAK